MDKTVEFIIDFASPNSYLAYYALPRVIEATGASITYTPCLLGGIFKATNNQAPMVAFANIKPKLDYIRVEIERFAKKYGLTKYKPNPHFPVTSLMLMRGAVAAQRDGYLEDYAEKMLIAMWEKGLKLDDPDILQTAWADAGLDANKLAEQVQNPDIKQGLIDNTAKAVERGVFGIPSFFVGKELFFGKENLELIAETLAA